HDSPHRLLVKFKESKEVGMICGIERLGKYLVAQSTAQINPNGTLLNSRKFHRSRLMIVVVHIDYEGRSLFIKCSSLPIAATIVQWLIGPRKLDVRWIDVMRNIFFEPAFWGRAQPVA